MSVIRDPFTSRANSTKMTINERFTYLQKFARPVQTTIMTIRGNNAARQQASAKSRRLAMQMEKRLSEMAALKIKKKSVRQRLGMPLVVVRQGNNVRDRLTLPTRGRGRSRNAAKKGAIRGRNLRRSQSMQSLSGSNLRRSGSMQSINRDLAVPHRSRSRSRTRNRTPSVGPKEIIPRRRRSASGMRQGRGKKMNAGFIRQQVLASQRGLRSNSVNFRSKRGGRNLGNQGIQRGQSKFRRGGRIVGNLQNNRGSFPGRSGRGRGRGGLTRSMRGNRNNKPGAIPTKEELDRELEQYMANTKSQLDKDIDAYMKESTETQEMWD